MLQLQTLISCEAAKTLSPLAVGLIVVPAGIPEHDHQNSQSSVVPSIRGTVYWVPDSNSARLNLTVHC